MICWQRLTNADRLIESSFVVCCPEFSFHEHKFTTFQSALENHLSDRLLGFTYTWNDTDVVSGQTYYYWLEDVDLNGTTTLHGPVSVTVSAPTAVTISDLNSSSQSTSGWPAELITAMKDFLTTTRFR